MGVEAEVPSQISTMTAVPNSSLESVPAILIKADAPSPYDPNETPQVTAIYFALEGILHLLPDYQTAAFVSSRWLSMKKRNLEEVRVSLSTLNQTILDHGEVGMAFASMRDIMQTVDNGGTVLVKRPNNKEIFAIGRGGSKSLLQVIEKSKGHEYENSVISVPKHQLDLF